MPSLQEWPEPIIRVQSLSESGANVIPDKFVYPPSDRPSFNSVLENEKLTIPVIDLAGLANGTFDAHAILRAISDACKEWGFFQVVNHGVSLDLVARVRKLWKEFFYQPMEYKEKFANDPKTLEGYGSRIACEKDAILQWNDYFFLELLPVKNYEKWPTNPTTLRETTEEYSREVVKLCQLLMKLLSVSLGLDEDYLQKTFGGDDVGASMNVAFYPKCPQPELTFGLAAHTDPGGLTVLLADEHVKGLQVRKGEEWINVQPAPNAFIVNIGDKIEVLSNGIYTSVEHRVITNSAVERLSLALFYNPNKDVPMEPAQQLVTPNQLLNYLPIAYKEYKKHIKMMVPYGIEQAEAVTAM